MLYLHQSPVRCHGRLKSSNVLIDSRWTCKVADMGLWKFREGEKLDGPGEKSYYYSKTFHYFYFPFQIYNYWVTNQL